jgi:hypothetical protein
MASASEMEQPTMAGFRSMKKQESNEFNRWSVKGSESTSISIFTNNGAAA